MTYESWRISYQNDEQAARAALKEIELLRSDIALARQTIDALQAAYRVQVSDYQAEEKAHHALQIGWLRAIDEAMVVSHLGVANADDSYEAAKEKLNNLICFHTDVATDPAVNGGFKLVPVEQAPIVFEGVHKVIKGYRWYYEKQVHVPTIELEFESVQANSPNDAKGWQDRDRLAAMIAAAPETNA